MSSEFEKYTEGFAHEVAEEAAKNAKIEVLESQLQARFAGLVNDDHRQLLRNANEEQLADVGKRIVTPNPDLTLEDVLAPARIHERGLGPDPNRVPLGDVRALTQDNKPAAEPTQSPEKPPPSPSPPKNQR